MPITSRSLDYARLQSDGRFRCRVSGVDAIGRDWIHGSFWADSVVAAETIRDGVVWNLAEVDLSDLLTWVQDRNTVASFDLTNRDITENQGEEFIITWFATHLGGEAITLAWWIESLNPPSYTAIANRIGYTTQQRSDVQDRAIDLLAAEPRFDLVVEV